MLQSLNRRCAVGAAVFLFAILGVGCESSNVAAPTTPSMHAAQRAAHDDDPATCRNGYTVIDGHIYCNPF
jgi:hypothetical protein